jgi:GT2 family glycosyltransferase
MKITSSLIIPIHNGIHYLSIFWKSLKPWLNNSTEVILIDDGSDQDVFSIFKDGHDLEIFFLKNKNPKGFASSVNEGIRNAKGDYLFILNADLIFRNDFVQIMVDRLKKNPKIGILGSKLIFPQNGKVQVFGVGFTDTNHFHLFKYQDPENKLLSNDLRFQAAVFAAVCIPKNVQEKVGFLDEKYFNGYEDLDYSFRVRTLGYEVAYENSTIVYHWRLQSGFGRDALRKENITRLWSNWSHKIKSDLKTFFIRHLLQAENDMSLSAKKYDLVILSGGNEWREITEILQNHLKISNVYHFQYRNRPNNKLWLPQILPPDFLLINNPIIYLIDEAPILNQNYYWYDRRKKMADDIIIDHLGNIIKVTE